MDRNTTRKPTTIDRPMITPMKALSPGTLLTEYREVSSSIEYIG